MTHIIQTFLAQWNEARVGNGAILHIAGSVGCGKSAALDQFLEHARKDEEGAVIVSARCGDRTLVRSSDHGELEDLVARIAEGVRVIEADVSPSATATGRQSVQWLLPGVDFLTAATRLSALPTKGAGGSGPSRARIYADLLLDIAREHPILLILDDVHRTDPASKALLDVIGTALATARSARLLLVAAGTNSIESEGATAPTWKPASCLNFHYKGLESEEIQALVHRRLEPHFGLDAEIIQAILDHAKQNPLFAHALVGLVERTIVDRDGQSEPISLEHMASTPEWQGITQLCRGQWPSLRADVLADLRTAAVVGERFTPQIMADLWSVPLEAAIIRTDGLCSTGLVTAQGDELVFLSGEMAHQLAKNVPDEPRQELHAHIGSVLRSRSRRKEFSLDTVSSVLDVTETWRETFRRDRNIKDELDALWAAAHHFASAKRHTSAAEAAVTLVESLFESSGGQPYLAGRFGRRADRERRHRIYAALTEASAQLELAERELSPVEHEELIAIRIRLLTVRSRFKEVMGDFTEAARTADVAQELAHCYGDTLTKLTALRAQLEVRYASGDINAAREGLSRLLTELDTASRPEALPIYVWLAEAIGRWEWPGIHNRLFPVLLDRVVALKAHQEAIRVCLQWLNSTVQTGDPAAVEMLLEQMIVRAQGMGETAFFTEELARAAAEMTHLRVDAHFDLLSGEFYVPDLFGEGHGPITPPLPVTLERPIQLLDIAEKMSVESDNKLAQLRVATTKLGTIYEVRERLAELLARWNPVHTDEQPIRLVEMVEMLNEGFMCIEEAERLSENIIVLADDLDLKQCMADTVYEALDRELPSAMRRADTLFSVARENYEALGDAYGLLTLSLVEMRHNANQGKDVMTILEGGLSILNECADQLSIEQTAFIHLRYGEVFLNDDANSTRAVSHLEQALRLYDRLGDIDNVQVVAELLREIYRTQGDLARYRSIRERFRVLERPMPGIDPLGLELRIEQLLSLARQESDDEKAIEMVERCVQLFGRMPDGTTRIDECFVEISKICRRRADEAQTEQGFQGWLQRSLEAVQIAASINRSLGNYFRVFEEIHELFDDLLGLGYYEEYVRIRAENRDLAFAVGNIAELLYLFEEHLQYTNEANASVVREGEVRGFYEALVRYLLGLGAIDDALSIQTAFVSFLMATGQNELAEHYRAPLMMDQSSDNGPC
ncbi:MAG: AAA family ATPase [Myxococcota bacterium]|nr:AAA family ATPase [Myxococcota bacterium]